MMKPSLLHLVLFFATILLFSACKKGKDDPRISFRSRNARFEGEWQLSSFTKTSINAVNANGVVSEAKIVSTNNGDKTNSLYAFSVGGNIQYSITQSKYERMTLSICSCSEAKITKNEELISISQTSSNAPVDTSKNYIVSEISIQNQSVFQLHHLGNYTETSYNALHEYGYAGLWKWEDGSKKKLIVTIDHLGTFYVKELRNSKMVLTSSQTTTDTYKSQTTTISEDFELTFTQK
ncbi:MAG: hypothetical protein RIQ33_806 [Bacteroidota bacterium]